jgi:hypothetical protein
VIAGTPTERVKEKDIVAFGGAFGAVPLTKRSSSYRSVYLLGAAPRWEDLFLELDAPRFVSVDVRGYAEQSLAVKDARVRVGAILGSAGSGKSTILRRVGLQLRQAGHTVYATNSESLPSPDVVRRVLDALSERAVLLFDNAEVALPLLPDLFRALEGCDHPPVLLVASRTNDFDRLWTRMSEVADLQEFHVPHLHRDEIESLVRILETQGLLGDLRGLTHAGRIAVFEQKAQKQILVAMREATTSKGFDLIIKDEFERITPDEAQTLYVCVALATDAGYRITREEFVACASVEPAEALYLLNRNLRDIVVPTGATDSMLLLRHRLLAELSVSRIAPRPTLREAYIRLLTALAPEVGGTGWRGRVTGLAHALMNHKTVYGRFRNDLEQARSIFSAVKAWYGREPHFWLQFGNLELEGRGGDLTIAENYLRQAESLGPDDDYIQNALGHLLLRKALSAPSLEEAQALLEQGNALLEPRINASACADAYAVHIYCTQRYKYARQWLAGDDPNRRREFHALLALVTRASEKHPKHQRLTALRSVIQKAYLQMGIPVATRPATPDLPGD